ncbi:hypothetical protein ACB092_10G098500 [Castanea dentata]
MARSFAPFLLLELCVPTMTHSEGQENFDQSLPTPTLTYEYEVLVSFRGKDTRTSFTSHFLAALDQKRIHAYRDDINLPRGGEIGPKLLKAIETSRIAIVLVKIMECKSVLNQRVLPIFYDVSKFKVPEQKGIFAKALLNGPVHKALLNGPEDKVNNWKVALRDTVNLAGWHFFFFFF